MSTMVLIADTHISIEYHLANKACVGHVMAAFRRRASFLRSRLVVGGSRKIYLLYFKYLLHELFHPLGHLISFVVNRECQTVNTRPVFSRV